MANKEDVCGPQRLRALIGYNPETGELTWKSRPIEDFARRRIGLSWNTRRAGKPALAHRHPAGHLYGRLAGYTFKAHRVAWAIHYGRWPVGEIDHIDGNPANNHIANLREATRSDQMRNLKTSKLNTSGVMGVYWHKGAGKWMAYIRDGETSHYLGLFVCKEDAAAARKAAERRLGFHENHGRIRRKDFG